MAKAILKHCTSGLLICFSSHDMFCCHWYVVTCCTQVFSALLWRFLPLLVSWLNACLEF